MAAQFIPVWQELGADHWPGGQAKIMVPHKRNRLVLLEGAKSWKADSKVKVELVGKDDVLHGLNTYLASNSLAKADLEGLLAALQARVTKSMSNGGLLLSITGTMEGQASITAEKTTLNLVVTKAIDYDITFKFLRCLNDDGTMI